MESDWAPSVTATVHPSAILRIPNDEDRRRAIERYVEEFRAVRRRMDGG